MERPQEDENKIKEPHAAWMRTVDEVDVMIAKSYGGWVDAFNHLAKSYIDGSLPPERTETFLTLVEFMTKEGCAGLDPYESLKLRGVLGKLEDIVFRCGSTETEEYNTVFYFFNNRLYIFSASSSTSVRAWPCSSRTSSFPPVPCDIGGRDW
jgi:hypothetical protein